MAKTAKQIFKSAFGAVRAANKRATTIGENQIVGLGVDGAPAICSGFMDRASQSACIAISSNRHDFSVKAAYAAVSCFAWRLYHAEHPATTASERVASRRAEWDDEGAYDYT